MFRISRKAEERGFDDDRIPTSFLSSRPSRASSRMPQRRRDRPDLVELRCMANTSTWRLVHRCVAAQNLASVCGTAFTNCAATERACSP
jgi:hypothetical protein